MRQGVSHFLDEYIRKRDFKKTEEPKGSTISEDSGDFMIHLHDATRLHYDLRLQWKGVLKSWAIPKGPSFNTRDKRLAIRTEDHPDEYKSYEGVIPDKQYGSGPSLIWDAGEFVPLEDFDKGFKKGHLRFLINGIKMKGSWSLIKMRGEAKKENWLLIKEEDEFANQPFMDVSRWPESVVTGRTLKEFENIEFTHPNKILFKEMGLTKADIWEYYQKVMSEVLRFGGEAPLTLVRCPRGTNAKCFFQKHFDKTTEHPHVIEIAEEKKRAIYSCLQSPEDLKALIQLGVLELHVWNSRILDLERPKYVVFDIDPDEGMEFSIVTQTAHLIKEFLLQKNYQSFARTTGGKGLHVVAPVKDMDWDEAYQFSKEMALNLSEAMPELYVATMSKEKRKNKVFIDYFRNSRGSTSIANYSTRAKKGATIATPLEWSEVNEDLDPKDFNIKTIPSRLAELKKDPWEEFWKTF